MLITISLFFFCKNHVNIRVNTQNFIKQQTTA